MEQTEDLSARVLLKHILITEPPRTPVTRSDSQAPGTSGLRRSTRRLSRKDAEPQTPQGILRRSLKHKIRENITRKPLPATKRTPSVVLTKLPAAVPMHFSAEDTPRHLLRNILQTEPVKSPVVHEKGYPEEPQPPSADKTVTKTSSSSIELSGLDLPDITIGNVTSVAKGLSRKRLRRSLNVTAFEKRLKAGNDAEEDTDISVDDHSSLSLSSSTSLSLKTPFADVGTEKKGLQRKVSARRKITEEEFDAAVRRSQTGDVFSHDLEERNLCEVTNSEGFTLGLSKLSKSDITTDILNCNTALYDQPDAMTSNFSILATQDKPTIMASQLQRDMGEGKQKEERSEMEKERLVAVSPVEEDERISDSQVQEDVAEAEPQNEEGQNQPDDYTHGAAPRSGSEEEAVESDAGDAADGTESEQIEAQTEEEGATDSNAKQEDNQDNLSGNEEVSSASQTEKVVEKEALAADSHSKDAEEGSQYDKEVSAGSETDEEEALAEAEQHTADSLSEGDEEGSRSKEEGAADSQTDEVAVNSTTEDAVEAGSQSEDEDVAESQTEGEYNEQRGEEEQASERLERDVQHIGQRAHRSEGALILPVARWTDDKSKAHSALGLNTSAEMGSHHTSQPQTEKLALTEPLVKDQNVSRSQDALEAEEEISFHLLGITQDIEVSEHESGSSPEEVPVRDSADQEEEWEEEDTGEEVEEFPCKTPAFVREKRNFFHPDRPASPSVFKNIQASETSKALPAAKPKKVRQKTGTTRKQGVLSKTYLMSVFRHFAKTKVSADVYPVLNEIMDKFFDRVAEDLETYAAHAKRKTIEVEDVELLLKRQGYVNDKVPVEVLIEKYLRLEQRKLLIPIATSGNVVIPKMKRRK